MESESKTDCIKVYVRVRPSEDGNCCFAVRSSKQIVFSGQNQRSFEFDHVADQDTTQSSVFSSVGRQIVESCVEGYNGTIFAYGQTGSGKTYTMLGPGEGQNADMDVKGLIPRSLDYLFELLNRKKAMHGQNFEYDCCASFLEIYNEQVYDLLDQFHTKSIALRESQIRGVYPEGIIERNVSNSYEAWNVLAEGWRNRRVSSTAMNRESSRSHAVFTLAVQTKEHSATGGITKVRQSVLNLVDLAGSERQKDTHSTGLQLREAGKINRSLSVLGQVIMALDDVGHGKQRFIPYRESKLTMLLRDSLGGNTKTVVVVNVHPNIQYTGETVSTLQFAQRAKQIRNRAIVNENTQGDMVELQKELKRLKEIVAQYEEVSHKVPINGDAEVFKSEGSDDYCEKFFWAMTILEQKIDTVKIHQTQIKKLQRYTLSKDFIVKLRDSALAAHEKGKIPSDDETIVALKKEIEQLKEQITHHPDVARYKAEISRLQNEMQTYQNVKTEITQPRAKQLQDLYSALLAQYENLSPSIGGPLLTPSCQSVDTNKAALDELKQAMATQKEELELMNERNKTLESELNGSKLRIEELNATIAENRTLSNSEFGRIFDMHNATLDKFIGTPSRKRGSLSFLDDSLAKQPRVGDDCVPCEKLLDLSIPEAKADTPVKDDGVVAPSILDQSIPVIHDDTVELALREELRQLSEELKKYRENCMKMEDDLAAKRYSESCLQEQLGGVEKTLTETNLKLLEVRESLKIETATRSACETELGLLKEQLQLVKKALAENELELKSVRDSLNSTQEKYFEKVTEVNSLTEQTTVYNEKIQGLIQEREGLTLEISVVKSESANLQTQLAESKGVEESLSLDLENARVELTQQRQDNETMQQNLEGKAKEVAEEIAKLRAENHEIEQRKTVLQKETETLAQTLREKETALEESQEDNERLSSTVNKLRRTVAAYGEAYSNLEADKLNAESGFNELMQKFEDAAAELDSLKERAGKAEEALNNERQEFETQTQKHSFEMDCLQEDLIVITDSATKFERDLRLKIEELDSAVKEKEVLLCQLKAAEDKVVRMEKEFRDSVNAINEENFRHKSDLRDLEARCKELDSSKSRLQSEIDAANLRIAEAETAREASSEEQKKIEKRLEREIRHAKDAADELEMIYEQLRESNQVIARHEEERERLRLAVAASKDSNQQQIKEALHDKETEIAKLKEDFAQVQVLKDHAEKELSKIADEKENLLTEVASLAGHQNHKQKIQHLVKVKDKLHKAEAENLKLSKHVAVLIAHIKKSHPEFEMRNVLVEKEENS